MPTLELDDGSSSASDELECVDGHSMSSVGSLPTLVPRVRVVEHAASMRDTHRLEDRRTAMPHVPQVRFVRRVGPAIALEVQARTTPETATCSSSAT